GVERLGRGPGRGVGGSARGEGAAELRGDVGGPERTADGPARRDAQEPGESHDPAAETHVGGRHRAHDRRVVGRLEDPQTQPEGDGEEEDRKSTRLNSSHVKISYAVFCLTKKTSRR